MEKMVKTPTPKEIFREFTGYKNPPVTKDIDIVWVISGHDAFDESVATSTYSNDYLGDTYRGEDRQRVQKGVELVRQVTAKRSGKKPSAVTTEDIQTFGPLFFYNGVFKQNEVLRNASREEFPLPKEKVLIEEITEERDPTPKQANTKTQFDAFPEDLLKELVATGKKMAIVTHRYHMPRVRRQVGAPSIIAGEPLWQKVNVDFFVADELSSITPENKRHKNAAFLLKAIKGETRKIEAYTEKGDLAPKPEKNS